jgi:hypothetical protein
VGRSQALPAARGELGRSHGRSSYQLLQVVHSW